MNKIRIRMSARHGAVVAGLVVAGSLLAACGGGGSSGGSTPVGAAASASSAGAAAESAYRTCLLQHGVTLPSRAPGQSRPSAPASGGGGGFGGFGGGFSQSPQMQAALQACASLRPSGGAFPGGGAGRGGTALVAFRNCMAQQGVTIPTTRPTARPTASSTDGSRFYLGGLDPNDPKVSAALKVCSPLLPSRSASAQPTS